MKFTWLKRLMPRSLYGRAALILIVPIVTLQLVVSIVFIQRLYEDVTRQMTGNVLLELRFLMATLEPERPLEQVQRELEHIAGPLGLDLTLPVARTTAHESGDRRLFYDLSGRIVIEMLREGLPGVVGIDLKENTSFVSLLVATRYGDLQLVFHRSRVSAANPHQLLVLMILTGLLMTIIAYLFLRNQLRPIKRLAAASEAFGKGQIVPYSPSGATEVRAAGKSFLSMRARIERQIEQRTLMLSGVSHDLRTPLTRLKLGLSLAQEDEDTKAMLRDVEDMQNMLDGFLSFARGDVTDKLQQVNPVSIARSAVERAARGTRPVTLVTQAEDREGTDGAEGDLLLRPDAIGRALDNLIANALRYGTRAEVSVVTGEKSLRFSVEDDGPGIAPENREEALKPFTRLEPARNQNRGTGVGLGLSIAADIARGHGGTLRLGESARLGGLQADIVLAK